MPIKAKTVGGIVTELKADNKKKGKAKGQNGKARKMNQIIAIALHETQPKMKSDAQRMALQKKKKLNTADKKI